MRKLKVGLVVILAMAIALGASLLTLRGSEASAGDPTVTIVCPQEALSVGQEFSIRLNITSVEDLYIAVSWVMYDSEVIEFLGASDGSIGGETLPVWYMVPENPITIVSQTLEAHSGSGYLCELSFRAVSEGVSEIRFDPVAFGGVYLLDSVLAVISCDTVPGEVQVGQNIVTYTYCEGEKEWTPLEMALLTGEDIVSIQEGHTPELVKYYTVSFNGEPSTQGLEYTDIALSGSDFFRDGGETFATDIVEADKSVKDQYGLPKSQHIAKVAGINPDNAKPVTVTRKHNGVLYYYNCFVTQSVADQFTSGDVGVGDYVVISYISEYPDGEERDITIVTDKVYKSWN